MASAYAPALRDIARSYNARNHEDPIDLTVEKDEVSGKFHTFVTKIACNKFPIIGEEEVPITFSGIAQVPELIPMLLRSFQTKDTIDKIKKFLEKHGKEPNDANIEEVIAKKPEFYYKLAQENPDARDRMYNKVYYLDDNFIRRLCHIIAIKASGTGESKGFLSFELDYDIDGARLNEVKDYSNRYFNKSFIARGELMETSINRLVQDFHHRLDETIEKLQISGKVITKMSVRSVQLTLTNYGNPEVGAHLYIDPLIKDTIYNPTSETECVFWCLEFIGITVEDPQGLLKDLGCKPPFMGVPQSKLAAVFKHALQGTNKRIMLYKFKDGAMNKGTCYGENTYNSTIYHMLLHSGHLMVILTGKIHIADAMRTYKESMFTKVSAHIPEVEELRYKIKPTEIAHDRPLLTADLDDKKLSFKVNRDIYYWDMETYTQDGKHVCYGISYVNHRKLYSFDTRKEAVYDKNDVDGGYYRLRPAEEIAKDVTILYGDDVINKFMDFLDAICKRFNENAILYRHKLITEHKYPETLTLDKVKKMLAATNTTTMVAHNGAKYDLFILLEKNQRFINGINKIIPSNGYISIVYGGCIKFIDSCKHLPSSLDKLCASMQLPLEYSKSHMPHSFMSKDTLYYRGEVPDEKYWGITRKDVLKQYNNQYIYENMGEDPITRVKPEVPKLTDDKLTELYYDKLRIDPSNRPEETPFGFEEFDLKKHITQYMALDVISLGIICHRYYHAIFKITLDEDTGHSLSPLDFVSLPALVYSYGFQDINFDPKNKKWYMHAVTNTQLKREAKAEIYKCAKYDDDQCLYVARNYFIDKMVRDAIYGGRVYLQKSSYVHPRYAEFIEAQRCDDQKKMKDIFESIGVKDEYPHEAVPEEVDNMQNIDVTSLYPSAMWAYDFPTGIPYFVENEEFPKYIEAMNKGIEMSKDFVCEVDLTYPDKSIVMPILGAKFVNGQTLYDLYDKQHYRATSVDLIEAVKYNKVQITKIHWILEYPGRRKVFKDVIEKIFNERVRVKKSDPVMGDILKLMINAFYGKNVQKLIDEKLKIVDDYPTLCKLYHSGKVSDVIDILGVYDPLSEYAHGGERAFCKVKINPETATEKELDSLVNRCPHLGVFILARSKQIMNYAIAAIDGFNDIESSPYYGDTDSFYIKESTYMKLKYDKEGNIRKNPWGYAWVNKDRNDANFMTQFHDDVDGDVEFPKILCATFVQPKVKAIEYICKSPMTKMVIHRRNCNQIKYSLGTRELSVYTKSEAVKPKVVKSEYTMKIKSSFKGFQGNANVDRREQLIGDTIVETIFGSVVHVYKLHETYDKKDIKVSSLVPDCKLKYNGDQVSIYLRVSSQEQNEKAPSMQQILKSMLDRDTTFDISYSTFKRDTKVGAGITTETVVKELNRNEWKGRYRDGNYWHVYGSNRVPVACSKEKLEYMKSQPTKGGFNYA